MSDSGKNPLLEPRLSTESNKEKLVRNLLIDKPNITHLQRSGLLDQVKNFLPQMAAAERQLNQAVASEGIEKFDVENVDHDENVIEMDIAVMEDQRNGQEVAGSWTSDSEDDSSPSPSENSFTSDTDISSSSTCSSSSNEDSPTRRSTKKRPLPLIEEMDDSEEHNTNKSSRKS